MDSREEGHDEYYRLPQTRWGDVGPELRRDIRSLGETVVEVGRGLEAGQAGLRPSPGELAVRLTSLGARLLGTVAADESDMRQVITTLRTALTVCWDMYGVEESERVTVREHMTRLRNGIEAFEADLVALHREQGSD